MLTIRQVYTGQAGNAWKIKYSNPGSGERGYAVIAQSINEIHAFIDHHHARPHDQSKCPACREEAEKEAKARRKRRSKSCPST